MTSATTATEEQVAESIRRKWQNHRVAAGFLDEIRALRELRFTWPDITEFFVSSGADLKYHQLQSAWSRHTRGIKPTEPRRDPVSLPAPPPPPRPRPEYQPPPAGPAELAALWQAHKSDPTEASRNALAEHYFPIVQKTAASFYNKLPDNIELDDLISSGSFGLLDAIRLFDLDRGLRFETYCIPRIRGAMLDYLRSQDWIPRLVRYNTAKIAKAVEKLERLHSRRPTPAELAKELDITPAQLPEFLSTNSPLSVISLDKKFYETDSFRPVSEIDIIEDKTAESPLAQLDRHEFLRFATKGLNKSERLIVIGYYFEDITMKEIADQLGLSESRVSQMHSQIIDKLRKRVSGRADLVA